MKHIFIRGSDSLLSLFFYVWPVVLVCSHRILSKGRDFHFLWHMMLKRREGDKRWDIGSLPANHQGPYCPRAQQSPHASWCPENERRMDMSDVLNDFLFARRLHWLMQGSRLWTVRISIEDMGSEMWTCSSVKNSYKKKKNLQNLWKATPSFEHASITSEMHECAKHKEIKRIWGPRWGWSGKPAGGFTATRDPQMDAARSVLSRLCSQMRLNRYE